MIMSFRAAALTLLLVLPSLQVAAQSKELRIGVDRRVELIAIIFKLAGSGEFSPIHLPQYSADIDRFFGPQRNHEAVTLARGLRDRYGVAQSRVMAIPIRLTDPPELKERVPFDSSGGWPAPPAETRRFVEAARRFAIDSRANDFFTSHRTLYDSVDGRIRPALERAVDLAWFDRISGSRRTGSLSWCRSSWPPKATTVRACSRRVGRANATASSATRSLIPP